MKTIIISLLLFLSVNAQNVWYVDRDAAGSNNGTSWDNAWKSINNINWVSVGNGDSIYVSGGTDSTLYKDYYGGGTGYLIYPSYTTYGLDGRVFTQQVVIAPAWQSGHNGDVYFGARDNNVQWILEIHNISNIKLIGFNFIDDRTANYGTIMYLGGDGVDGRHYRDSLITFENCHIVGNGLGSMIYLSGYKITIKDCLIEQPENNTINDQDPFGISGGKGEHTIDRCTIIMRNGNEITDAHRDGIQISNIGWAGMTDYERHTFTISNNLIIDTNPNGISWNNMIYNYGWDYTPSIRFLIYNNIIVTQKINTPLGGIAMGRLTDDHLNSLHILNNTIIMKNNGNGNPIVNWALDTLVVKNNLVVVDTNIAIFLNINIGYNHYDINYNHYAEYDGIDEGENFTTRVSTYTWQNWKNAGYDVNSTVSSSGAVTFANKYGLNKADYYTTTGRDAGVDLSSEYPFLTTDILGNPRSGSWDIGALEFQGSQSSNIIVKSKIFLQGPFNTNLMMTNLSQNSLLPNTQPFNTSPWNYNGSESLGSSSTSSYVDWVLVELRNSSNPTQIVARRAAILNNDGTLLNTDGSTSVPFNGIEEGSYYIAVFHRNHLAIMSANPVQLTANSPVYDFTNEINKAYGTDPMVNLGDGKFGMYAGDGNSNGGVTITDRNEIWAPQNGTMGYLNGDFNLDGGVTASDVNLYWNINNGTMTQVP